MRKIGWRSGKNWNKIFPKIKVFSRKNLFFWVNCLRSSQQICQKYSYFKGMVSLKMNVVPKKLMKKIMVKSRQFFSSLFGEKMGFDDLEKIVFWWKGVSSSQQICPMCSLITKVLPPPKNECDSFSEHIQLFDLILICFQAQAKILRKNSVTKATKKEL